MATSKHVKTTGKWKPVKIDYNLLSQSDFGSFISLEELTDYDITCNSESINEGISRKEEKQTGEKGNEKLKKKEANLFVADNKSNKREEEKNKKKKKKKKKKETSILQDVNADAINKISSLENEKDKSLKEKKNGKIVPIKSDIVDVNNEIKSEDINIKSNKQKKKGKKRKQTNTGDLQPSKKSKLEVSEDTSPIEPDKTDVIKEMILWKDLYVPEEVLLALRDNKFTTPTHIQSLVLPHAIRDRLDIVGAAETGSGKTLAFGIPLIDKILKCKEQEIEKLNVTESDEIIEENIKETIEDEPNIDIYSGSKEESELEWESDDDKSDEEDDDGSDDKSDEEDDESNSEDDGSEDDEETSKDLGCVSVIDDADFSSLGIDEVKVDREDHPLALILEPTRELAVQVRNHLLAILKYTDIKVATIVGGMSIQKQQRILKKKPEIVVATPGRLWELFQMGDSYLSNIDQIHSLVIDEADRMVEKGHFEELEKLCLHINKDDQKRKKRQNFVFSATLTMIHVAPYRPTKKKKFKLTEANKLEALIEKIGLKNKPKVIDLSRKSGTVETLTEARINCTKEEKDIYLYYFLNQFPGRTLVFANSKDCIRRLMSIFTLLETSPMQLHADMHQKQRLKNLERFTANPRSLLLASDVAARGLDIPNVQHVIHYQVPLTVENYVHRSGRTARASKEGISVMLVGPDDVKNYRKIIYTLNRNEDLPIIPVDYQLLPALKQRLNLALKIDVTEYRFDKKKRQNDWFLKAAKEMDMEIDDRHLLNDLGDSVEQSQHKQYIKHMKQELSNLLHQSLTFKTFSGKYPTKTGKLLIPEQPKKESDAISCVKKDKKSQEKLIQQIKIERILKQTSLLTKQKEKQSNRQKKKRNRKKNKEI